MTNPNYAHVEVLLDRSGSMRRIKTDMEGGLATLLDEQRKRTDKTTFALRQFDHAYEVAIPPTDIRQVVDPIIVPRGNTALYDALGRGIVEAGEWLNSLSEDERPEHVFFIIVTDGLENASTEWTKDRVFEAVKHQEEAYGWNFAYLGANQDAMQVGGGLGIGQTRTYTPNAYGTRSAYAAVGQSVASVRAGASWQVPQERESER